VAIAQVFAGTADVITSTSYVAVDSMDLSPGAGEYLIVYTQETQYDATPGGETINITLDIAGSQITHTERQVNQDASFSNLNTGMVATALVSLTGSEIIQAETKISADSHSINNRLLTAFPTDIGNSTQVTDVASDTLVTATFTLLDTMTLTPTSGSYLLVFSASCRPATNSEAAFEVWIDGVAKDTTRRIIEQNTIVANHCVMIATSITVNGSEDVEIRWSRLSGAGTIFCWERSMVLHNVLPSNIFEADATAGDVDATTNLKQIEAMLINSPGANNYLILFSSYRTYGTVGGTVGELYNLEGASAWGQSEKQWDVDGDLDNMNLPIFMHYAGTTSFASDDISAWWDGTSTNSRTLWRRNLVALAEASLYNLSGVTYDKDGSILGDVECYLWKDNGNDTLTWVAYQLSNSGSGVYAFADITDNDSAYLVTFVKDDSPHVMDVTDHNLTPVL